MNGDGFKLNTTSAVSCKLHRVWLTRGVVRHGWRQGHNVPTTTSKHQIRQPKTSQIDFDRNLKKTSNSAYVVLLLFLYHLFIPTAKAICSSKERTGIILSNTI